MKAVIEKLVDELPPPPPGRTGWPWTAEGLDVRAAPESTDFPKISIVTPSYNQGHFIEETIRSVLLQGYPNLEYLVIDGGSTDESLDVLNKYDDWLTYWVSEPDRGQSHAINKGWARCTGDYLSWLNSDDALMPAALFEVADLARRSPGAGWLAAQERHVDESGRVLRDVGDDLNLNRTVSTGWTGVSQAAVFVSAEALAEVGAVDEDLHFVMDRELWSRLALRFRGCHVPEPWALRRMWAGAKSVDDASVFRERLIATRKLFTRSDLPDGIRRKRRRAFAQIYLNWSHFERRKGRRLSSLGYLAHAARFQPGRASAELTRSLAKALERMRGNRLRRRARQR